MLQETHNTQKNEFAWENDWKGKCFFSRGESNDRGTAILIYRNPEHILVNSFSDKEGRLIGINCEIDSKAYCIINFSLHYNEKRAVTFVDRMNASTINENILNLNDTNIIMGGYSNCPLDIKKDKKWGRKQAKTKLIQFIEGMQTTFKIYGELKTPI